MIKNIGKIAVLHLGLILAIGAATTVEASRYEYRPNKTLNPSNLSNAGQSATNNNNNNTMAILQKSIINPLKNSSQFNSSNSNPSKTTTIGGNNYQFPKKAPFTPQFPAVSNNNTTQPKSNDMQSTNSQKIHEQLYSKTDTLIPKTDTLIPKTDTFNVIDKVPIAPNTVMMYEGKPLFLINDTTNQPHYSQPTTTNLFSNNNKSNTFLNPNPSSFGGQGQSTNNISQQTKMYTNLLSGTGVTGDPSFSHFLNSPQFGNTTNQNNITGSSPIAMGPQEIKENNTKKLSECKVLLQDIINDYIAMEQYEKNSKDSPMSEGHSSSNMLSSYNTHTYNK